MPEAILGYPSGYTADVGICGEIPTCNRFASTYVTRIAAAVTSKTLLAANTKRKGFYLYHNANGNLYVLLGDTVSSAHFTTILSSATTGVHTMEMTQAVYTGVISGVWSTTGGYVHITEY